MPTLNENLQSNSIERAILLQRYGNGLSDKALALLKRAEIDIERKLKLTRGEYTRAMLEAQLVQIRQVLRGNTKRLEKLLEVQLKKLAKLEAKGSASDLKFSMAEAGAGTVALSRLNLTSVAAATMARPFQGKLLKEWIKEFDEGTARAIRDAVRIGFVEGETAEQITRRVFGTRSAGFKDGIMHKRRNGLEAMVRTAIAHVSNFARQKTYEAFTDDLAGLRWVSVLDNKTTPICQSRSGNVYPVNRGPRPPAHVNCRSTMSPVVKGERLAGSGRTQASMDGQVPANWTYEDWLRNKGKTDPGFVAEVLGKKKARLFMQGKLSVKKFVNPRGKTYTLNELESKYPDAWKKAGLD